jgi:hypothetical protein
MMPMVALYGMYEHADGREQNEDPGSKPEGIIALADAISGNQALSCEDGKCYHPGSVVNLCPAGHSLLEFQTPNASFNCDGGEGCPDQGRRYPVGTSLFGCRICNFDFCSQCVATTAKTGVPLSNGVCLHCGQSKDQHKAKGALSCEDGGYYHDWRLNEEYQSVDEVLNENKEELLADFKEMIKLEGEEKQELLQEMGQESMPTEKQYLDFIKPMIEAQIKEAGVFKYVSVAPDVDGQHEDPDVPLNTGNCLCCKKPN